MYSNEKHRENGIFDIILSVVFYIMIFVPLLWMWW